MLRELGALRSTELLGCRRAAGDSGRGREGGHSDPTYPHRSSGGVPSTVDDGAGPIDATFFPDAQDPYAQVVFHSWLLLVRGRVRRTGPRGVSLRATGCWDLAQVQRLWSTGGAGAVHDLLEGWAGTGGVARSRYGAGSAGVSGSTRVGSGSRPTPTSSRLGQTQTTVVGSCGRPRRLRRLRPRAGWATGQTVAQQPREFRVVADAGASAGWMVISA